MQRDIPPTSQKSEMGKKKVKVLWYAPWFGSSRNRYLNTLSKQKFETKLIVGSTHYDFKFGLSRDAVVLPRVKNKLQEIANLRIIIKTARAFKPDLLLVDDMGGILKLVTFILMSKRYSTVFAVDDVVNHDEKDKRSWTVQFLRALLIGGSRGILVFSENSKTLAENLYLGTNVYKVPLLPEVSLENVPRERRRRKDFAMIGRWSDYKGFDIGIDIFLKYRMFSNSPSNLELWCSGTDNHHESTPGIIWRSASKFDWQDLLTELPQYRGVLLPYRSATQSGVQVLAWQSGVPCLISNLPGLVENQPSVLDALSNNDYKSWFELLSKLESDSYVNEVGTQGKISALEIGSETAVGLALEKVVQDITKGLEK